MVTRCVLCVLAQTEQVCSFACSEGKPGGIPVSGDCSETRCNPILAHAMSIAAFLSYGDNLIFRAAMTPFLANQSLGVDSYKWILFGEDDTVFFISNAMKLLQHLDHNLPYLLTDNIQYPQQHINGKVKLCLIVSMLMCMCLSLQLKMFTTI